MSFAWEMFDAKVPWERSLLETEKSCVTYLIQGAVAKNLCQWFMVSYNEEVMTALSEILCLFKALCYG